MALYFMAITIGMCEEQAEETKIHTRRTSRRRISWIYVLAFVVLSISTVSVGIESWMWLQPRPPINTSHDCALLFFGLPKRFQDIVYPSIQKYIISYNPNCDIFAHSYDTSWIVSKRNKEFGSSLTPQDLRIMTPHVVLQENPPGGVNFTYYRQFYGWKTRNWEYPTSMDNMIKQWNSLEGAWKLMEEHAKTHQKSYARVGFFRPDVLYDTPIALHEDAVMPRMGIPSNDRLFYGTYENAKIWSTRRFSSIHQALEEGKLRLGLHSETYLAQVIYPQMTSPVVRKHICFYRVRNTGFIRWDDCWDYKGPYFLLHPWRLRTLFTIILPLELQFLFQRDGRPDIAKNGVS